ncbi:Uncharacterized protein GBIM_03033 [Gryllus bimaculatus]|nr:Uncharacterized protein GBIM_03033 [Gryllus bimaculatus]
MEQVEEIGNQKSIDKHVNEAEENSVHGSSCGTDNVITPVENSSNRDNNGKNAGGVESTVITDKYSDFSGLNTVNDSEENLKLQVSENSEKSQNCEKFVSNVTTDTKQIIDYKDTCKSEQVLGENVDFKKDIEGIHSAEVQSESFPSKEVTKCDQEQLGEGDNRGDDTICLDSNLPTVSSSKKVLTNLNREDNCLGTSFNVVAKNEQKQNDKESASGSFIPSSEVEANISVLSQSELEICNEPSECGDSRGEIEKVNQCDESEKAMQTTATICESDLRSSDDGLTENVLEETDVQSSERIENNDLKNSSENNVDCEMSDNDSQRVDSNLVKDTATPTISLLSDADVASVDDNANCDLIDTETSEKDTESELIHFDKEENLSSEDTECFIVQKTCEGESQIAPKIDSKVLEEEEQDDVEMSDNVDAKSDNVEDSGDRDKSQEFAKQDSDADMIKEIEKDGGENSCDMQRSVEFVQIDSDKDENSQQSLDRNEDAANDKDPIAILNDKEAISDSNEGDGVIDLVGEGKNHDAVGEEDPIGVADEEDKDPLGVADEEDKDPLGVADEEVKDPFGVAGEDKDPIGVADEEDKDLSGVADKGPIVVADEENKDPIHVADEEDKDSFGVAGEDKDPIGGADKEDKNLIGVADEDKNPIFADEDKDPISIADEDKDPVDVTDEEDKDSIEVVDEEDKDPNVADEEDKYPFSVAGEDKDPMGVAAEVDKDPIDIADEEDKDPNVVAGEDKGPIDAADEEDKDPIGVVDEDDNDPIDVTGEEEKDPIGVTNEEDKDPIGVADEEVKDPVGVADEDDNNPMCVVNEEEKDPIGVTDEADKDPIGVADEGDKDTIGGADEERDAIENADKSGVEKNRDAIVIGDKRKDVGGVADIEDKDIIDVAEDDLEVISVVNEGDKGSISVSKEKDSVSKTNEKVKDLDTISSADNKVSNSIPNEEDGNSNAASNEKDKDDLTMDQETGEQPMEVDDTDKDDISVDEDAKTADDVEEPVGVDISLMCETVLEESTAMLPVKNAGISKESQKKSTKRLDSGDAEIVEIIDGAETEKENEKQRLPSKTKSGVIKGDVKSKNVGDSASLKNAKATDRNDDEEICIIPDTVPRVMLGKETKGKGETPKGRRASKSNEIAEKVHEKTEVQKDASETRRTPGRPQRQAAKRAECQIKEIVANDEDLPEPEERVGGIRICDSCFKPRNWVTSYKVQTNGTEKVKYFCSQDCASNFKRVSRTKLIDTDVNSNAEPVRRFTRKCAQCTKVVNGEEKNLSWETMDFCNEECLGRYQKVLGSQCANCKGTVASPSLGKYCVRFGYDVKQFCCSGCLEEFKKGLKVCSYCQKDISGGSEGFLAPVGDKGQFKDFCTQSCMEKYDQMSNNHAPPVIVQECAVCNNEKVVSMEVMHKKRVHKFCSEPCFAAFRFVNGMAADQCYMCKKFFDKKEVDNFAVYSDDLVHSFCSKTCMNVYILANRKIVPCHWCKVKKYNFDMIKRVYNTGQLLLVCSLNCLSLYQVGANVVSSKRVSCDFCNGMCSPQYNLNMSDNTVRNFCGYQCVMKFQEQFANAVRVDTSPFPTGGPKRYIGPRRSLAAPQNESQRENVPGAKTGVPLPVISSVQSLAGDDQNKAGITTRSAAALKQVNNNVPQNAVQPSKVVRQIIVRPPAPKPMRNKAITCRPTSHTKGTHCRPIICTKETQTETHCQPGQPILIPVPVPIYVPTPMCMYSSPFPVPVPFPLPVPVPIFIPTTRSSAKGILKEIKRIQEKTPADPFEAELLMMAEIVAGEKKEDNSDSDSDAVDNTDAASGAGADVEEGPKAATTDGRYSPETVDSSNTFGDDMLQMALKMATELEEPTDLEAALTPTTITSQPATNVEQTNSESEDDPEPAQPAPEVRPLRGRKRSTRTLRSSTSASSTSGGNKRRRVSGSGETLLLPPPEPPQPPVVEQEKPDANMCLKFTLGVNAWKRWVLTKNAELEKAAASNRKLKLFKPEILQQTADELNYSLCLFVKEVRKPNGQEYAPDTIYYLCLGIQQYLFESGRIDNIFTDPYYEKFTECLDEVAKKFSTLYNDSQYIVTRVEEEHLWESKQLGAHSPHVLLSTLMFFNTKHFNLVTVEEHMQLSFSHIMKHWKRNPNQSGASKGPGSSRNVLLRFYPPQSALEGNSKKKKVYEQQENEDNPLRCPVKLYEFYLSNPESVKTRNDVFYLLPERSCVPDSPVWYSTMALGKEPLMKMLHRVKMVKEINQAILKS